MECRLRRLGEEPPHALHLLGEETPHALHHLDLLPLHPALAVDGGAPADSPHQGAAQLVQQQEGEVDEGQDEADAQDGDEAGLRLGGQEGV